jgi:hypothetical protein
MPISLDEVAVGVLVNAIAVAGRQISKATAGLQKQDEVLATARWFETFRLSGAPPGLPGLPAASAERLAAVLGGAEVQAALQELLAVRLTDAPEADASRARDAVGAAVSGADPDVARFAGALADYYDDQVCSLVARLEAEEPPVLAQIRSEAFSSRIISVLHAIERNTAVLVDAERRRGGSGLAAGGAGRSGRGAAAGGGDRPVRLGGAPAGAGGQPSAGTADAADLRAARARPEACGGGAGRGGGCQRGRDAGGRVVDRQDPGVLGGAGAAAGAAGGMAAVASD